MPLTQLTLWYPGTSQPMAPPMGALGGFPVYNIQVSTPVMPTYSVNPSHPNNLRPRESVYAHAAANPGFVGPTYTIGFEWDTDPNFGSVLGVGRFQNTGTGGMNAWIHVPPPVNLGPAGTTWFVRMYFLQDDGDLLGPAMPWPPTPSLTTRDFQDDDANTTASAVPFNPTPTGNYLYLNTNVGVGFHPADDPTAIAGVFAWTYPDGNMQPLDGATTDGITNLRDQFLYQFVNVGPGWENVEGTNPAEFEATDITSATSVSPNPEINPTPVWRRINYTAPDGNTRDFPAFLYQYVFVNLDQPCPYITEIDPPITNVGDAIVIKGQGLVSASSPAPDTYGAVVELYDGPDCTGALIATLPITTYTAGVTEDTITVTIPPTATSGHVAVRHTAGVPTCACSNSKFLTVIGAPPNLEAGWWIEVWTLDGVTKIIDTARVTRASFTEILNDVGHGSMTMPRETESRIDEIILTDPHDAIGNELAPLSTLCRVYLHGILRYSFFAEQMSDPYELDGRTVVDISGPGKESSIGFAVVFPADYPTNPTVAGDWAYTSTTAGQVMQDLFLDAQGRGTFPFMTHDFSPTLDSSGDVWDDSTLGLTVRRRTNYKRVLEQLAALGYDWEVTNTFVLRLFNTRGLDYTVLSDGTTPTISEGKIIGGRLSRQIPSRNVVFLEGEGGLWTAKTKPLDQTTLTRREFYVAAAQDVNATTLDRAADSALETESGRKSSLKVRMQRFNDGSRPYVDFQVGDTILVDLVDDTTGHAILATEYPDGFRVKTMTVDLSEERPVYEIDLNYQALEDDAEFAASLRRLLEREDVLTSGPGAPDPSGGNNPATYASGTHTHVEAQITDLGNYLEVGDAVTGDVTGTLLGPLTVVGLQGDLFSNTAAQGEIIWYNAGAPEWGRVIDQQTIYGALPATLDDYIAYDPDAGGVGVPGVVWKSPAGGAAPINWDAILDPNLTFGSTADDDFTGGVLDAKWTVVAGTAGAVVWPPPQNIFNRRYDITTRPGNLLLQSGDPSSTPQHDILLRQTYTLPQDRSIIMALAVPGLNFNTTPGGTQRPHDIQVGISLSDSTTDPMPDAVNADEYVAAKVRYASPGVDQFAMWVETEVGWRFSTTPIQMREHHLYTTNASGAGLQYQVGPPPSYRLYLRIDRNAASQYVTYWSNNGMTWTPGAQGTSMTTPLDNLWIFVEHINVAGASDNQWRAPVFAIDWIHEGTDSFDPW